MARKKKPPSKPSNAYLLSFGDTMTTLLAFFIILNSMASDQTGANLHAGTGSFMKSMSKGGMRSNLVKNRQKMLAEFEETKPLYVVPSDEDVEPDGQSKGPDEKDDGGRVIDREREEFERLIDDLNKLADIDEEPDLRGEIVFDYFDRLSPTPPLLKDEYRSALTNVIPLLYQPKHRVEIIVWATMPSTVAWEKAAKQAEAVGKEVINLGNLNALQRKRLRTTAKTWFDKEARRPILSIVTRKY